MTEIEKYDSDIRIPLFDKASADYCFKKSKELLSRPLNFELAKDYDFESIQKQQQQLDKKTRDLIGENLLEIENTLKALNLDFLQTYNELDKTDSAETLFDEPFTHHASNASIRNGGSSNKIRNSALNLYKGSSSLQYEGSGGSGVGTAYNSNKLDINPSLEKQLQQATSFVSSQIYSELIDKLDDKRSTTPDTGFASRETNNSSRRSSQKSNYSPQDTFYSPKEFNFPNTIDSRPYMNASNTKSSPVKSMVNTSNNSIHSHVQNSPLGEYSSSRQRSMSFTDNYDLKSPVLSEPQNRPVRITSNFCHRSPNSFRNKPRNIIAYKPRSIKARTLRRLSYNPIILDSSSSTSSDEEFDHSIAHSECDIRTKMMTSARKRRQYMNRKTALSDDPAQNKIYGSNTSIKSAPQYNYCHDRRQRYANPPGFRYEMEINEKIYDFGGGRGPGNNYGASIPSVGPNSLIKPPRAFAMNGSNYDDEFPYTEFDVSKLTGKSPTTHNYFHSTDSKDVRITREGGTPAKPRPQKLQAGPAPGFQWPEKIAGSTVKQNDLMWLQQQTKPTPSTLFDVKRPVKPSFSSDSSSSDDTDEIPFTREFNPRVPPSPAP